jgi:aspartyl-tRNA(Asn)/glutamyl-tRNA(Gln) amidotransferase subunit A
MFQALGVYDPQYPISINESPYDYPAGLREGVKGIRIGLPTDEWIWEKWVPEEHEDRVRHAVALLEGMGAHVVPVSLPLAEESRELSESLGETESWYEDHASLYENASKWDELQAAIQANRTRRVNIESYVAKARKRLLVKQELVAALKEVDVIAMPTGMTLGDKIGADTTIIRGREVPTRSRGTRLNSLASITGFPALSVPCGFAMGDRLPVGLQLMGRPVEEPLLYRVAYAYEQATEWHLRHPPI